MPSASDANNASSLIGRTIGGRYTVKATIGSGGMGHVYRATQAPINREVAIKVLRIDLAHQEGVKERFQREARAASLIQHPNAITIFDFGEDDGLLYLSMEFLSGETLRQRLRREPPLEVEQALDMFEGMAGALGAAHRVGVVHRDLKPDNIFLAKFDAVGEVVKVLDFGLAKLLDRAADTEGLVTDVNLRLGTPRYMAPEQALGIQPIDSRCDVYALALLLFEMLAQRAPFVGEDGMEVLAQRLRREAPRLSTVAPQKHFSEEMDELLASMLKRDREHRPQDANVILTRLREIRKNYQVYKQEDNNETQMAQAEQAARSGNFVGRPTPSGVRPNGSRPGTVSGRQSAPPSRPGVPAAAASSADGLMRLDQDDFPEKPTVVVDPHMMGMGGDPAAAAARSIDAGLQPLPPGPVDMARSMSGYSRPSQPPIAPVEGMTMGSSATIIPTGGRKRRTVLIVALVVAVAVLAPLIAYIWTHGRGDEHTDQPTTPDVVTPGKTPTTPPPTVTTEKSTTPTNPTTPETPGDKGTKKPPIRKPPVSPGKKPGGKPKLPD